MTLSNLKGFGEGDPKADYGDKHPYAASHPFSKGKKLKPKGAPAPYAKSKALAKKSGGSSVTGGFARKRAPGRNSHYEYLDPESD